MQMDASDWRDLRVAAKWGFGVIGTISFGALFLLLQEPTAVPFGAGCAIIATCLYLYDRWRGAT